MTFYGWQSGAQAGRSIGGGFLRGFRAAQEAKERREHRAFLQALQEQQKTFRAQQFQFEQKKYDDAVKRKLDEEKKVVEWARGQKRKSPAFAAARERDVGRGAIPLAPVTEALQEEDISQIGPIEARLGYEEAQADIALQKALKLKEADFLARSVRARQELAGKGLDELKKDLRYVQGKKDSARKAYDSAKDRDDKDGMVYWDGEARKWGDEEVAISSAMRGKPEGEPEKPDAPLLPKPKPTKEDIVKGLEKEINAATYRDEINTLMQILIQRKDKGTISAKEFARLVDVIGKRGQLPERPRETLESGIIGAGKYLAEDVAAFGKMPGGVIEEAGMLPGLMGSWFERQFPKLHRIIAPAKKPKKEQWESEEEYARRMGVAW